MEGKVKMEDWQKRVVKEREELNAKLCLLLDFIVSDSPKFTALDARDKFLLRQQLDVMVEYRNVLQERIVRFDYRQ